MVCVSGDGSRLKHPHISSRDNGGPTYLKLHIKHGVSWDVLIRPDHETVFNVGRVRKEGVGNGQREPSRKNYLVTMYLEVQFLTKITWVRFCRPVSRGGSAFDGN